MAGDTASLIPEMSQAVSKEVEDEANSYFQRIYNHPPHPTLSIDEVLEMLKRFKESTIKKEKVMSSKVPVPDPEPWIFYNFLPNPVLKQNILLPHSSVENKQ